MPMPITPQVPTSSRLRGLYMSITPRVRSSVLAPSLTRIASGRSLTMVRGPPRGRRLFAPVSRPFARAPPPPAPRPLGPAGPHALDQSRDARADVAHDGGG